MTFVLIAVLVFGAYSAGHLLWAVFAWEIRWEMRLIRLAVHSALFGAAAAVLGLLWAGGVEALRRLKGPLYRGPLQTQYSAYLIAL